MSSSPTSEPTGPTPSQAPGEVATVPMPQMGVSVAEGTIAEWRVAPGDRVEAEQTICEVTTDKVDVEIPAPISGVVERLLAEPGETVSVGHVIAEIRAGADNGEGGEPALPQDPETDRSGVYSPVVRRIAAEHGIDLRTVEGHGVGGRIRKRDLLDHIEILANGNGAKPPAGPARREPMSAIRRQTAERMLASRRTAAHCTSVIEVDCSRILAARESLAPEMAERGVKLTPLAFIAAASSVALGEFEALNASVEGDEIVYHREINLGIAVATDAGLIVPVIRQAQRLSLEGLAAQIGELAERARSRSLEPDDVAGATFTITNPGQFGTVLATPIISQPQVAILDLEAIVPRPVAIGDAVAIRPIANLCLSWDHRALDGVEAARFLAAIRDRLQSWEAG